MELPEEMSMRRNIMTEIKKMMYPTVKNDDDCEIVMIENGEIKKISNNNSKKAKLYTDKFDFLDKSQIKSLKKWGIEEVCIFISVMDGYIPVRSHAFEKLIQFSKKSSEEITVIMSLIIIFLFLIFILYPQLR